MSGNLFEPDAVFRALTGVSDNDIDMDGDGHFFLEVGSYLGGRGMFEVIDTNKGDAVVERYLVMIQRDPTFEPKE